MKQFDDNYSTPKKRTYFKGNKKLNQKLKNLMTFESFDLNEGTANFARVNTNKIYAIGAGSTDQEAGDNYNMAIEEIELELDKAGYDKADKNKSPKKDNRSFPGRVIATKDETKSFGGVEFGVEISAVERAGYYQGACLDLEIEYNTGGEGQDELPSESDIRADIDYYGPSTDTDNNVKQKESALDKAAKDAAKWLEETATKMSKDLEAIYKKHAMSLKVGAQFSSGETHYEKDDK